MCKHAEGTYYADVLVISTLFIGAGKYFKLIEFSLRIVSLRLEFHLDLEEYENVEFSLGDT